MAGDNVSVVGRANSAGQTALHLARFARKVTFVVRGPSLEAGMSDYLVRLVAAAPSVEVRVGTRVDDGRGERRLEGLVLERDGQRDKQPAACLFVMIGPEPRTGWLGDAVMRVERGYVLTAPNFRAQRRTGRPGSPWPGSSSLPGNGFRHQHAMSG